MESQKSQPESGPSSLPAPPATTSCRKKKSDDPSFMADLRDHIDEFINASMDEHKTCFKKTIHKMFGMSKIVAEKNSGVKEVESVLPLKATVAD
ncbi:hypothetical protein BVC80_1831g288 [Macleaya cordata]|uniref:Uncharacterized protein n=1 Tax=Macleaya cordata TaxID=56857 RepID=A0A200R7N4_MACCD|nr:hypothetical protein BVC80_1831g288 [Macleaya cordata]